MSEEKDIQGQTTHNKEDKHPYHKKIQIARINESSVRRPQQPQRIGAVAAKKHLTIFPIRERRKKRSQE